MKSISSIVAEALKLKDSSKIEAAIKNGINQYIHERIDELKTGGNNVADFVKQLGDDLKAGGENMKDIAGQMGDDLKVGGQNLKGILVETGNNMADGATSVYNTITAIGNAGGAAADAVVAGSVEAAAAKYKIAKNTLNTVIKVMKYITTDPKQSVSESYLTSVNTNNYLADPNGNGQNGIFNSSQTLALINQQGYSDNKNDQLPAGFKVLNERVGEYKSGYDVRVYINEKTQEIIISHRGSEASSLKRFLQDWVNADGGIALGSGPKAQIKDATAYNEIIQKLIKEKYPNYTVTQTGHSLGGFIAQVIGAKNGQNTVTFDSPGAKEYIDKLGIKDYEKNITTIQGPNNLINQAGSQPGSTLQIQPADVELGSTKMTIVDILTISGVNNARSITILKHYISNLVTMGKSKADELLTQETMENDKISRSELVKLISTWDSGQSLANNAANWHTLDNYWKYYKDPACVPMKVIGKWKSNRTLNEVLYGDINTGAITRIGVNPPKPSDKKLTLTQDKSIVAHAQTITKRAQMLTKTIGLK